MRKEEMPPTGTAQTGPRPQERGRGKREHIYLKWRLFGILVTLWEEPCNNPAAAPVGHSQPNRRSVLPSIPPTDTTRTSPFPASSSSSLSLNHGPVAEPQNKQMAQQRKKCSQPHFARSPTWFSRKNVLLPSPFSVVAPSTFLQSDLLLLLIPRSQSFFHSRAKIVFRIAHAMARVYGAV